MKYNVKRRSERSSPLLPALALSGLASVLSFGIVEGLPRVYGQEVPVAQPDESREAMLQRLSTQSGFSIDRLVQIEQEMKRPVCESLPPSENVVYLPSWEEFQQAREYEPPTQWTKRDEWDKHMTMFRDYVATTRSSFEHLSSQQERNRQLFLFFYADESTAKDTDDVLGVLGSRGLGHALASATTQRSDISIVAVPCYDSTFRTGISKSQSDAVKEVFSVRGVPAIILYRFNDDIRERVDSGAGSAGKLEWWVEHYTTLRKAISTEPVLRTQ